MSAASALAPMKTAGVSPLGLFYVFATVVVVALLAFLAIKVANVIGRKLEQREAKLQARRH